MSISLENLEPTIGAEEIQNGLENPEANRALDAFDTPLPPSDDEESESVDTCDGIYAQEQQEPSKTDELFEPKASITTNPPPPNKFGKRSREEYEQDEELSDDEFRSQLPIPKRTTVLPTSSKPPVTPEQERDTPKNTPTNCPEESSIPSSASDSSSSPSTVINEEAEANPKVVEIPFESGELPRRVSKRRRITETFKGLFNVFGGSVSNALSLALDH